MRMENVISCGSSPTTDNFVWGKPESTTTLPMENSPCATMAPSTYRVKETDVSGGICLVVTTVFVIFITIARLIMAIVFSVIVVLVVGIVNITAPIAVAVAVKFRAKENRPCSFVIETAPAALRPFYSSKTNTSETIRPLEFTRIVLNEYQIFGDLPFPRHDVG
ncbi:hypothetical protein GQX74_008990 [Glossina fuscipes]|nr:hypothetical protein GQX74_008990 [Glossina fuscipes]